MGFLEYSKDFVTLAIITALIAVGLMIALRSGVVAVSGDRCRLMLGNLSYLIVEVAACVLLLAMVQQLVGLKFGFP